MSNIDAFRRNFDFLICSESNNPNLWSDLQDVAEYSIGHDQSAMVIAWVGQMIVSLAAYHQSHPDDNNAGAAMQSVVDMMGGYLAELSGWERHRKRNGMWE